MRPDRLSRDGSTNTHKKEPPPGLAGEGGGMAPQSADPSIADQAGESTGAVCHL